MYALQYAFAVALAKAKVAFDLMNSMPLVVFKHFLVRADEEITLAPVPTPTLIPPPTSCAPTPTGLPFLVIVILAILVFLFLEIGVWSVVRHMVICVERPPPTVDVKDDMLSSETAVDEDVSISVSWSSLVEDGVAWIDGDGAYKMLDSFAYALYATFLDILHSTTTVVRVQSTYTLVLIRTLWPTILFVLRTAIRIFWLALSLITLAAQLLGLVITILDIILRIVTICFFAPPLVALVMWKTGYNPVVLVRWGWWVATNLGLAL